MDAFVTSPRLKVRVWPLFVTEGVVGVAGQGDVFRVIVGKADQSNEGEAWGQHVNDRAAGSNAVRHRHRHTVLDLLADHRLRRAVVWVNDRGANQLLVEERFGDNEMAVEVAK